MQLLSLRSMGMSKFTHCKQRTIELSSALQHELHFFVDKFDYVAILLSSEYTAYYGLNNISLLLCSDASPSTPYFTAETDARSSPRIVNSQPHRSPKSILTRLCICSVF